MRSHSPADFLVEQRKQNAVEVKPMVSHYMVDNDNLVFAMGKNRKGRLHLTSQF